MALRVGQPKECTREKHGTPNHGHGSGAPERRQGRQRGTEMYVGNAQPRCTVSCRVPEQTSFVQPGKEMLWGRDVTEQGDKLWGLGDTKS